MSRFNDLEIVWLYSPKRSIGFDAEIRDTRRIAELIIECCRTGDEEIKTLLLNYYDYSATTFLRTWEIRTSPTTIYYIDKERSRVESVAARLRGEQQLAQWEMFELAQKRTEYSDLVKQVRARRQVIE